MHNYGLTLESIPCTQCANAIAQVMSILPGVVNVVLDASTGRVTVESSAELPETWLLQAIKEVGYTVKIGPFKEA